MSGCPCPAEQPVRAPPSSGARRCFQVVCTGGIRGVCTVMHTLPCIRVTIAIAGLLGLAMTVDALAQQLSASPALVQPPATPMEAASDPAQVGKQHETHHGRRVQPTGGHIAARQQRLKQERGGAAAGAAGSEYVEKLYDPLMGHSKHMLTGHYQHPLRRVPGNFPADGAAPSAVP